MNAGGVSTGSTGGDGDVPSSSEADNLQITIPEMTREGHLLHSVKRSNRNRGSVGNALTESLLTNSPHGSVCISLKGHALKQTISAPKAKNASSSSPWVCISKVCCGWDPGRVKGWSVWGWRRGLKLSANICRPLCYKARKISLLSANNPKWKPGTLENLHLTRFICSVRYGERKITGAAMTCPEGSQIEKGTQGS